MAMNVVSRLPYGLTCGHTWAEVGAILGWIEVARPSLMVEIGTHEGGFAVAIAPLTVIRPGFKFVTVEINPPIIRPEAIRLFRAVGGCVEIAGDCFSDVVMRSITEWVAATIGPAFIYCDGGDKVKEIAAYKHLLRPGDFIGLHDYWHGPGHLIDGLPGYGTDPNTWTPEVRPIDVADMDFGLPWLRVMGQFDNSRTVIWQRTA